jgi:hypothetical protein
MCNWSIGLDPKSAWITRLSDTGLGEDKFIKERNTISEQNRFIFIHMHIICLIFSIRPAN